MAAVAQEIIELRGHLVDSLILARELKRRGFTVHPLDLSEFLKAGGAARCLTLQRT